jgi:hypothetical protein
VYAEYKASVAQHDLADRTLEVAHKASVAQQDLADRTLVALLDVEYQASVAAYDSVDHLVVAQDSDGHALVVDDVQGTHPRYEMIPE